MEIVIVCFITFILSLSICFEYGREYLKESTAEVFQPILTSLYSELTLLGFIGLLLFAIFKCEALEDLSISLFGEADAIQELGEQVHMVLFLVMVVFLLQAVAMGRFGETIQRKWHVWEAKPVLGEADAADGYARFRKTYRDATRKARFWELVFQAERSEKHRMLVHTAARLKFIEEANLKASDFDFARYLSVALGVALGELVEVPVKTWFVLEAVLLFFWRCETALAPNARVALWILTGYVTAASAYVVHGKLRLVLHKYTAPLIKLHHSSSVALVRSSSDEPALVAAQQQTAVVKTADPKERRRAAASQPTPSDPSSSGGTTGLSNAGTVVARFVKTRFGGGSRDAAAAGSSSDGCAESERSGLLAASQGQGHTHGGGGDTNNEGDEEAGGTDYHELFWLGHRFHAHFTFDAIRLISLLTSIYAAIFVLVYFGDLVVRDFDPDDMSPQARAWRRRGRRPGGVVVFLLACVPPFLVVDKIKSVLEDFTVAANISEFKNRRYVEQVLRRQKTVAAFEALKVVQCFRQPDMLDAVLAAAKEAEEAQDAERAKRAADDAAASASSKASAGPPSKRISFASGAASTPGRVPSPTELLFASAFGGGATGSGSASGATTPTAGRPKGRPSLSRRRASYRALTQLQAEEEEAFIERQRVHWRRIFDLFDDDKEGSIDRPEMRALLSKFKCDETHIARILATLDTDNDGVITFDEFFDFANKLSTYLEHHSDPALLTREMFELIDRDMSGTITVHEMHNVVADMLGQDLSVEDVFNVIQDIDADGNGELDIAEFRILLDRFGIYAD